MCESKAIMKAMASVPLWDEFIKEHLLHGGLFYGVCLLSQQGENIYAEGLLQHLLKDECQQFLNAFRTTSQKAEEDIIQKGFHLTLDSSQEYKIFKIYHKSYTSIYSVSADSQMGVLVGKLPHSVIVCLYSSPVIAAKAIKQMENFCDKLRS